MQHSLLLIRGGAGDDLQYDIASHLMNISILYTYTIDFSSEVSNFNVHLGDDTKFY